MQQLPLRICRLVLLVLGCCGLAVFATGSVAAQGARVWLDPETLELAVDDVVTVDIRVDNVVQMAGAEVHLTYDPALLEVVDADPATEGIQIAHGDFLSPDFVVQNGADQAAGTLDYAIACMPLDKAVSGDGVLARITLRGLAGGEAPVAIHTVLLANSQGQMIAAETGSSQAVISRPSSPAVWLLIGLAVTVVAIATGATMVLRNAVSAHNQKGGEG